VILRPTTASGARAARLAFALAAAAGATLAAGAAEGVGAGGALAGSAGRSPSAPAAALSAPALLDFSPAERLQILQHGPWPPPSVPDAGNALSGRPAAIALGASLFTDHRLSGHGRLACVSCHVPALGLADGRVRGEGLQPLDRHTPSLWNAGQGRWFGWDGAFDSLWSQALQPLQHPAELGADATHLRRLLTSDARLACLARAAGLPGLGLGAGPGGSSGSSPGSGTQQAAPASADERLLVGVAKAIGAWVATLQSPRTPFDEFRDALARGDRHRAARYPLAAQRGLRLFIGRGQCSVCHVGPAFTNGEFADIGIGFFVRPGVVDPGRHGGIAALQASRFNLLGPHADAAPGAPESARPSGMHSPGWHTAHVLPQHRNFGEFKVPGLRNLLHTAPYMHAGQRGTLAEVVGHYSALDLDRLHADGEQILQPLRLSPQEAADLEAFLRSLSTPEPPVLPRPPTGPRECRDGPGHALR